MTRVRHWEDTHKGSHRHSTLKTSFLMAAIAQGLQGWFTTDEFHAAYVSEVGQMHKRTICRYLRCLEMVGVIEERPGNPPASPNRFRWIGWPEPIISR